MATGNFYNKNASKIFACEFENVFEYDDLVLNIQSGLNAKFGGDDRFYYTDRDELDNARNYCGRTIGEVSKSKNYGGMEMEVSIAVIIREGYYTGVNVDWDVKFCTDERGTWEEELDEDETVSNLEFYTDLTEKRAKYIAGFANQWLENAKCELIEEVEKVIEEFTTPLVVTARFSNGETIYGRADNKKARLKALVA